jgi:hypothetical protein
VGVVAPKYAKLKSHHPRVHVKDTPSIQIKNPHVLGGGKRGRTKSTIRNHGPNEGGKNRGGESIHKK